MSAQTETATDPGTNQRRMKLTAACESCRKRKARCSGTAPCLFCQKNSFRCEFNYDRQRRGPKTNKSNASNSFQVSGGAQKRDSTIQKSPGSNNSNQPGVGDGTTATLSEETEILWQLAVQRILDETQGIPEELKLPPDLIIHLLIVFITHVHNHHPWIFDPEKFPAELGQQDCSPALLYAISAASLKFSRHPSAMKHAKQSRGGQYAATARQQMLSTPNRKLVIGRIQCLCVLAMYEIGEGNGRQAWCDISAAHSLIQVALACELPDSEPDHSFKSAYQYLSILEREFCLGHNLTPSVRFPSQSTLTAHPTHLSEMLDLLLGVQKFSMGPYTTQHPPPWSVNSDFMNHREALDRFLICHSDELQFSPDDLADADRDASRHVESLHCSLAWHCAVIILNRVYLPVPGTSDVEDPNVLSSPAQEVHCRSFPLAPKPFLDERIQACESSASAICDICKDVLGSELFLLPSFMGYCCFQSSIVLINKLRRTRGSDSKVIEELKVNFTTLGAMRKFYEPAHAWVETLFELHQPNVHLRLPEPSCIDLFANYFSRFIDIKEPPCVPFEAPQRSRDVSTTSSPQQTLTDDRAVATLPPDNPPSPIINIQKAWMNSYRDSIQSHIHDLDDEPVVPNDATRDVSDLEAGTSQSPELQTTPRDWVQEDGSRESEAPFTPVSEVTINMNHATHGIHSNQWDTITMSQQMTNMTTQGMLLYAQGGNSNALQDLQNGIPSVSYNGYPQVMDFNLSAFLEAGERMFPPLGFQPFPDNLDWMISNSNGDSEGTY